MKLSYTYTLADAIAEIETIELARPVIKANRRTHGVIDIGYMAVTALFVCHLAGLGVAASLGVATLAVVAILWISHLLRPRTLANLVRSLHEGGAPGLPLGPRTLALEGANLIEETAHMRCQVSTEVLARPIETATHVFLQAHPGWVITIPRAQVPGEELARLLEALPQKRSAA